jgi:predicted Zn-dependent peptidase
MNASTDKEVTVYWTRVPAERLDLAVDVLLDMVGNSQLAPSDVDRERMVILEELKMYQDQPQDYVHSIFERVMWPGHPLGRDIIGTTESISRTSRDDLVDYVSRHYATRNLVVGISGGIDPGRAAEMVENHMALPDAANAGLAQDPPAPLSKPNLELFSKDTEQAHICLGSRAVSYLDDDRHTLDLINTILGEGMSSRLFLEIREKRGLAYDVHSFTSKQADAGYFAVYLGVDPTKAPVAVEAVVAELHRIVEQTVSDAELTKAREFTKGRLQLGLESTNSIASWLCQQELLMGRIRTVDEVVQILNSITPADIRRVAQRVLDAPLQMAVIGPFDSDTPFRTALAG